MKNIIGIQCRYSSSRLPGKALLPLGEITILGAVILRCLSSNLDTYILTSNEKSDDVIEKHANLYPIKGVIRGSLKNVQERYRNLAIKEYEKLENWLRIIKVISSNYSKYDKIRLNAHKYAKKYNIDWRINKLLLF
mgnify:CR=1 FL=1